MTDIYLIKYQVTHKILRMICE